MKMHETVPRVLRVLDFGRSLVPYGRSLRLQELLFSARRAGSIEDTLVLLQVCRDVTHFCCPCTPVRPMQQAGPSDCATHPTQRAVAIP